MKRVNILLRKMKVQFGLGCFVGLLSLFGIQQMHAQQLPISDNYLFNPRWMNPAMMGTRNLNHFMMSHQQRKLNYGETVRSMSQFLNFSSAPLGRTGTFGWGGAASTIAWVDRTRGIRASGWSQIVTRGDDVFSSGFGEAVYASL